ncbi:hypothetical protein BV898_00762 [Hypsibius exemplaris]|uniref:Uncharacterized protein n=1 Tax=Hypsibius exemplaris TaxID=2072580 RepID=A0A1W0XEE8_HYPEX|nr:hypothetical protein BV898_00762 [Hypsibius exemplaris]
MNDHPVLECPIPGRLRSSIWLNPRHPFYDHQTVLIQVTDGQQYDKGGAALQELQLRVYGKTLESVNRRARIPACSEPRADQGKPNGLGNHSRWSYRWSGFGSFLNEKSPSFAYDYILVTAMLFIQPVLTMNSTPPTRIIGIGCAEMEKAGPRLEHVEKQIRQRGHTFYFCNVDSIRLRQLDSTTIGFGVISINLDGPETSVENPQDSAKTFLPWYWYPQAWLENVSLSADVYCCSSSVLPRHCSRGFRLVYGDKTEIPVTEAVSETSPFTDAMTDAPTDMITMLTSSPTSMTSLQTSGIPAQQSNYVLIAWRAIICDIFFIA